MEERVELCVPPESKYRFRYASEGADSSRALKGNRKPLHPTIKVNTDEPFCQVDISCVSDVAPFRAHPHSLVGEGCLHGFFKQKMPIRQDKKIEFCKLRIQQEKKQQYIAQLTLRKNQGIDPFDAGFAHNNRQALREMNMGAVRLAIQVWLPSAPDLYNRRLQSIVSEPITNAKIEKSLVIEEVIPAASDVTGGGTIVLWTAPLPSDVAVRFFHDSWEVKFENIPKENVKKDGAIKLRIPAYNDQGLQSSVKVCIQLYRPGHSEDTSEAVEFLYFFKGGQKRGHGNDENFYGAKRQKIAGRADILRQSMRTAGISNQMDTNPSSAPWLPSVVSSYENTASYESNPNDPNQAVSLPHTDQSQSQSGHLGDHYPVAVSDPCVAMQMGTNPTSGEDVALQPAGYQPGLPTSAYAGTPPASAQTADTRESLCIPEVDSLPNLGDLTEDLKFLDDLPQDAMQHDEMQ